MIEYHYAELSWRLGAPYRTRRWLRRVLYRYGWWPAWVSYVFMTDAELAELNETHLQHTDLTDILTFDYTPEGSRGIHAEIFISVERVRENARLWQSPTFLDELHRVMVHGLLHIVGFDDHADADRAHMRAAEEAALAMRGPAHR